MRNGGELLRGVRGKYVEMRGRGYCERVKRGREELVRGSEEGKREITEDTKERRE